MSGSYHDIDMNAGSICWSHLKRYSYNLKAEVWTKELKDYVARWFSMNFSGTFEFIFKIVYRVLCMCQCESEERLYVYSYEII